MITVLVAEVFPYLSVVIDANRLLAFPICRLD
jgi:hypothetical protein